MDGFGLLLGHLVGDYILQNDYLAKNKVNPYPVGPEPQLGQDDFARRAEKWWYDEALCELGHIACSIHCLLYTLAVWACSWTWMPWWGLLACFAIHWPVDRFRLARFWMENVSGQHEFANGVFSPWSIIVVDNIFHLLTLYFIWGLSTLTH